ncbi:GtrA family protein [uncultured Psychroserpens sp.]|uniref:GtrA family protein n=1 Tax=uncultured Psychroserpens sp. TaxID=255436 RepID=UPI00260D6BC2|nr:GtrA family protein [uncultured Psychroserpens sp.]
MLYRFYNQYEFFRMLIIAVIGAIIGFITYEIIYYFNPFTLKVTLSWIIAFIIGVARQHALHRYFTFRDRTNYLKSLYRAYIVDIGALLYSTGLSWLLSKFTSFSYRLIWLICFLSTAIIGLAFLKRYIFKVSQGLDK